MAKRKRYDTVDYGYAPPGTKNKKSTAVKPFTLEQSMSWLGKAVATEVTRPILTWGNRGEVKGKIAGYTSDGYRMHFDFENGEAFEERLTFPKSTETDDGSFKYPSIDALIPINTSLISINVHDLIAGTKRAMVFARDSANSVKFIAKDNEIKIVGLSAEYGDCVTTFPYLHADRDNNSITISLNGHYVLDALAGFVNEENVYFHFVGGSNPCYFTDAQQNKRLALLMPMSGPGGR